MKPLNYKHVRWAIMVMTYSLENKSSVNLLLMIILTANDTPSRCSIINWTWSFSSTSIAFFIHCNLSLNTQFTTDRNLTIWNLVKRTFFTVIICCILNNSNQKKKKSKLTLSYVGFFCQWNSANWIRISLYYLSNWILISWKF